MKVKNNKGFTLAELLIVMAIVVVLAAVAVPTFGRQMETSRETADMEVVRNCYEEVLTVALRDSLDGVLDGYDGTDVNGSQVSVTSSYPGIAFDSTNKYYTVTLTELASRPKMSQGSKSWQYVKNVLFGVAVPQVIDASTTALTFTFELPEESTSGAEGTAGTLKLSAIGAVPAT